MKTTKIYFIISLLAVIMTLAACKPVPKTEVVIGEQDGGSAVTMRSDQTLTVQLESNITTGYSWGIAECDEKVLKAQGDPEYITDDRAQKLVGAGGAEVFHFKPVAAGATHLKLVYRRPWEKDVEPVETFEVDLTVQ